MHDAVTDLLVGEPAGEAPQKYSPGNFRIFRLHGYSGMDDIFSNNLPFAQK
jgi:hypothetical protein